MKKYQTTFPSYGQSVAGRIAYYQKLGVAQGIISNIKLNLRNKLELDDWNYSVNCGNGKSIQCFSMTLVIPTPEYFKEVVFNYPSFEYNGKRGIIDMINIQSELQFHIMLVDWETKTFANGYWHTVREGLNLEDTCTLYEYIEDRMEELIVLSPGDTKYNSTGALGINK